MPRRRRAHHHVYVVELHPDVLLEAKFRKNNPGYIDGKPCVYVGMTGLDPDVRFDKHKAVRDVALSPWDFDQAAA